jgi:hypothetical protein
MSPLRLAWEASGFIKCDLNSVENPMGLYYLEYNLTVEMNELDDGNVPTRGLFFGLDEDENANAALKRIRD